MTPKQRSQLGVPLNRRERQVHQLLDSGATSSEVAKALDWTVNTARWYRKVVRAKLKAQSAA